jgi:hypothetical protein
MASNKKTIVLGLDYSQFDGGITEVNRKMGLLDAEFKLASETAKRYGDETTQLSLKQEKLTQQIGLQSQKVNLAKEAYDKAMSSGKASEATIDKLDKALLNQRTTMEKLKNELADVDDKLVQANKAGNSFGDTIRGMASTFGLEVSPAIEGLASKFDGLDANVGNAILGIGAMVTALGKMTIDTAAAAGEIDELSHKTGLTTDTIQELKYAAEYLEISAEDIGSSIAKMTRNMDSARSGTGDAAEAFKQLKVRITDSNGQLKDSEQVFYDTIDALGNVKNETERNALSMSIFGKSAMELNNVILEGSEGVKNYAAQAHEMGAVIDKENIDKFNQLDDAMTNFGKMMESVKNNLALGLLPLLTGLFEAIGSIPTPVLQTLVVLGGVVTTIILLVKAIKSVTETGSQIKEFFTATNASTLKTIGIVTAVVAVLIALATVISVIMGRSNDLQKSMASIGDSVGKVTSTVANAQNTTTNAAANSNMVLVRSSDYGNAYYAPASTVGRGYASGTNNFPGGETWINEGLKPERVVLPSGSQIIPANESGNGDIYNINMSINASDIDDIQKVISVMNSLKQVSRQGRVINGRT